MIAASEPALYVVVGGGGVGKTTTSAGLGIALARRGKRVLVVTVDPARRLADALGITLGKDAVVVPIGGVTVHALMPDSRAATEQFTRWLFENDSVAADRFMNNRLYLELADAIPGMHEVVCAGIVDQALRSGAYDAVVLDTAPSRHALQFMDYPAKLAEMLEARTIQWVAGLAVTAKAGIKRPRSGIIAWGRRRLQRLVGALVGAEAISDVSALFAELLPVRDRWVALLRRVEQRMQSASTRYLVVTGLTGAAVADAEYLGRQLANRTVSVSHVLLNRAALSTDAPAIDPAWVAGHPELAELAEHYSSIQRVTRGRTEEVLRRLASDFSHAQIQPLPELAVAPREILLDLATHLDRVIVAP